MKSRRHEEIFGDRKFVSYVDLVFVDETERCSFEKHEAFAEELCRLLSQAPEIAATVELVIRNCYYHQQKFVSENEAEQGGMLSKTVKDSGMSLSGNDDTMDHSGQADVARYGEYTDIAPQEKSARVANHGMHVRVIQDDPANVFDDGRHVRALRREELSKVTNHDEQGKVLNHGEFAALTEESNRLRKNFRELICYIVTIHSRQNHRARQNHREKAVQRHLERAATSNWNVSPMARSQTLPSQGSA